MGNRSARQLMQLQHDEPHTVLADFGIPERPIKMKIRFDTAIFVTLLAFVTWSIALMFNWNWFMVPFGLPVISFFWAAGIFIVFSCLIGDTVSDLYAVLTITKNNQLDDLKGVCIVSSLIRPLFFVIFGYIIHLLLAMTR